MAALTVATGVTALTDWFVLFKRFGSPVVALTTAVFVTGPLPGAVEITLKFVVPPAASVPTTLDSSTPPGPMSTTTTLLATLGPMFVTVITFVYCVPANTVPGAAFNTPMSATFVTTVVTGGLALFVPVGVPTNATFVNTPPAGAFAGATFVTVTLTVCPFVSVPKFQITTPAATFVVPPALAPAKLTPAGKASVTTTPDAALGPAFVTTIV